MAAGDLYDVRVRSHYLGQTLENTFFFLQNAGALAAANLASVLDTVFLPSIVAVQSVSVQHFEIVVENRNNPADFSTITTTEQGVRTGEPTSPFTAWGYRLETTDRRIRAGGKRFGGVSETDVVSGIADSGVESALENLADVMNDTFVLGGFPDTWKIVLHTENNKASPQTPLTVGVASVAYVRVTTQSSRKFSA